MLAIKGVSRVGIKTAKVEGKLPFKYLESGGIKIMKVQRTIAKLCNLRGNTHATSFTSWRSLLQCQRKLTTDVL